MTHPDFAPLAALLGEPARARIAATLMDGRAFTATELALEAGVAPSTASEHLARLEAAGLLARAVQGRHRYFRLASHEVAAVIEALMGLPAPPSKVVGPRDPVLRAARVCYDHLAGERGVALLEGLRGCGHLDGSRLTASGEQFCEALGLDLAQLRARGRPLVRTCLDWSERRDHLAGALGAALLERLLALRHLQRGAGRSVSVTPAGARLFSRLSLSPGSRTA
jgi:DNA-binding transcriptional ArsR family regulator